MTHKWYQFGEALCIDKDTLDKYTNYPPEVCIVEVLDYWLRNQYDKPTWRDVAMALKKIGLQQLSEDILMRYKTGWKQYFT